MNNRYIVCSFQDDHDLLNATQAVRRAGYTITETYTPFAVHGLDVAQGLKRSKLPWICLGFGLSGAIAKLWYQIWTSATSWPVNVGGKPLKSVPAFVPVTFEMMVLFAGVGTVLAFFWVSKLWPGKQPKTKFDRATDDLFYLLVEESDAAFDARQLRELLDRYNVVHIEERVMRNDGTLIPAEVVK